MQTAEEYANDFPEKVYAYLSVVNINPKIVNILPWEQVIKAFLDVSSHYAPKIIPLLDTEGIKRKPIKHSPWEYSGRTWFMYLHMFAEHYQWDEKTIASLPLDTALPLLQEMLVNEQLEREFIYSLSEIAYPYDKNKKKSVFHPLGRPAWMQPKKPKVEKFKTRIPKKFLPVGNVINSAHGTQTEASEPE